jgi:methylenetetrahydrofolate dehydrogenase (NADP+)/methenyltetrahydrofolate cyclohydrolase
LARLLEGKPIAEKIKEGIRQEIARMGTTPVLASVQVGVHAAAETYVKSQRKAAEGLGITYQFHRLEDNTTQEQLVSFIEKLNKDVAVHGIIIQMPLPAHIEYKRISQYIAAGKDIEGMHPANMGKLVFGKAQLAPCTPQAVMELLQETGVDLSGKEVVVVGHSEIVGKPLALMLLEKLATVTVCHIGTAQAGRLQEHVARAEILIVAVGKAGVIKGDWIREGAIVIDVGINRVGEKIVGDVEFEAAQQRASFITPVPGGVGPLTVTMLMRNVVKAAQVK